MFWLVNLFSSSAAVTELTGTGSGSPNYTGDLEFHSTGYMVFLVLCTSSSALDTANLELLTVTCVLTLALVRKREK